MDDFFESEFTDNQIQWIGIMETEDENTPNNLKSVIQDFFIKDNILFGKYLENLKAKNILEKTSSLVQFEQTNGTKINCSFLFRKYFSERPFLPTTGLPYWFYLAYPEVANWIEINTNWIENEIGESLEDYTENGTLTHNILRFLLDKYKSVKGNFELSERAVGF
jgi:hypothetical protein